MIVKRQIPCGNTGRTAEAAGDDELGLDQQQEGPQGN